MRKILGALSVLVVAFLMAQLAPAVVIAAQTWTDVLRVPEGLVDPLFFVLAGLAVSVLAFALVWAVVRVARAPCTRGSASR